MHRYRSHTCAALRPADVGTDARLSGWVHRVRDHGGLLFIDLRDHYGLTQCVVDPDSPAFRLAETLRAEWVIRVDGKVKARTPETLNPNLPTGGVEVFIEAIEVLGAAKELPLPVFGEPDYPEDIRLRYRFLDLRRETLHANIVKRTQVIAAMRREMATAGFAEYSTPILTASSPEGARDFLVPSRIHPGKFFALPQAPQQYKQLLMVAGFDRYFQIAPCFRDEDPRADRLPGEFYQLDLEMSFVTQEDVWNTMAPVMTAIFEEFADGKPVTKDWPRIPYDTAIRKYGTDKPDLRNPIEMQAVTEHFAGSAFKVFAGQIAADAKTEVWAIPALGGGSRAFCDRMNGWAQSEGQPGLGYIFWRRKPFEPTQIDMKLIGRSMEILLASGRHAEAERLWKKYISDDVEVEPNPAIDVYIQTLEAEIRIALNERNGERLAELRTQYYSHVEAAGPIAKALGIERCEALRTQLDQSALRAKPQGDDVVFGIGSAVFFVLGRPEKMYRFAGEARTRVGTELKLVDTERFELCWIVDFPFYEWNEDEKRIDFSHNPFSMPAGGLEALTTQDPLTIKAFQYDAVCNGFEIASGSIRNQEPETMVKAFELTGKSRAEVEEQFGGLYRAFQYGAPPHGGAAFGVDRIVMLLCGAENLREITLFPMNQQAEDLLMGAPSPATARQLRELHIRLNVQEK